MSAVGDDGRMATARGDHRAALSFLDLPPEIRNQVYTIVLHRKRDVEKRLVPVLWPAPDDADTKEDRARRRREARLRAQAPPWRHTVLTTQPGRLACTCRQVYHEFAPMVFASHMIVVSPIEQVRHRLHVPAVVGGSGSIYNSWAPTYALDFLERTTLAPPRDLRPPLLMCTSLQLAIATPVTPATQRRWHRALAFLAEHGRALRELRVRFDHDWHLSQCLIGCPSRDELRLRNTGEARVRPGMGASGEDEKAGPLQHPTPGCCVELAEDVTLIEILGRFRGLDRLKIRAFSGQDWSALLEQHIDPGLAVYHVGFLHLGSHVEGVGTPKLMHADYRRPSGLDSGRC
ncbi:hypothetical protein Micbo1qcDRAFT_234414 [Microdochium bolleyi]|uniref:Uncharacterized protein n=1 Tax=Microdochium bolleyi TaxID=196109 RepID=A0A136IZQ6_9PEZI|nr:hypothetical protein Micbo1qcDRAFT_234414 [Microdochium bolleyi]